MKYQVRRPGAKAGEFTKVGDFGFEELRALHQAGVVKGTDGFSVEGKTEWASVGTLFPGNEGKQAGKSVDSSLETRGRDAARGPKVFGAILACVGTLLLALDPGIGCVALTCGLVIFIYGRFQE